MLREVALVPAELNVLAEHERSGAVIFTLETEIPGAANLVLARDNADDADRATILVENSPAVAGIAGTDPDATAPVGRIADDRP